MKYQAYDRYKDSGVPWLGDIPEGWKAKRLRFLLTTNPKRSGVQLNADTLVSFIPMDAVGEYGGLRLDEEKQFDEVGTGYTYFADDDVVVAKITPCFENGKGALAQGLTNKTAFGTTELHVLRASSTLDQLFLFYITISEPFRKVGESTMLGAGGQKRISDEFIKDFLIGTPSIHEQKAIAAFLDEKTAEIDDLIAKKEALLKALAEKRTAIITYAVTKGLNPKAKLKPSGVAWLGDIPENWEIWKASHGFKRIGSGTTPKSDNLDYYDGDIPWVTTSELREIEIKDTEKKLTNLAIRENPTLRLYRKNSLLIAMYGATIGRLGILGLDATVNQACCVFENPTVFENKFVFYWFLMAKPILLSESSGGGQPNLNQEFLKSIKIATPSILEQQDIVSFLDEKTAEIDGTTQVVKDAISKLKEYRTSLITNAVTGKIKVA